MTDDDLPRNLDYLSRVFTDYDEHTESDIVLASVLPRRAAAAIRDLTAQLAAVQAERDALRAALAAYRGGKG